MARQRKRFGEVIRQQPSRFVLEIAPALFDGNAPHAGAAPTPVQQEDRARQARSRFFDEMRKRSGPSPESPEPARAPAGPPPSAPEDAQETTPGVKVAAGE
jgi:hypothetical protein